MEDGGICCLWEKVLRKGMDLFIFSSHTDKRECKEIRDFIERER